MAETHKPSRRSPDEQEEQIARFIESDLLEGTAPDGEPLASGAPDSLAIEVLIARTEDNFEISLSYKDVVAENSGSVRALSPPLWTPSVQELQVSPSETPR